MRIVALLSLMVLCSCITHDDYLTEQSNICKSKGLHPHIGYSYAVNANYVTCEDYQ